MTLGGAGLPDRTHHSSHSIASDLRRRGGSAACAAGLDAQQMRWVLDYAAQQASGIEAWQRDTDHIEKSLVFGGYARAQRRDGRVLIHLGGTGVDDVLSGPDNFLSACAPEGGSPRCWSTNSASATR